MKQTRRKRSIFYTKYTDKEIAQHVKNTTQIGELIKMHDMRNIGSNSRTLRKRLDSLSISYLHWVSYRPVNRPCNVTPSDKLFVANSDKSRGVVKRRIIKEQLLPYTCSICNLNPTWNNKSLVLILDHINGIPNDHQLKNLRFHPTQTASCGRTQGFPRSQKM